MTRRKSSTLRTQRGSISVEFALVMPLLVIVIIGGVHFGRVLMTRHEVTEATNYATRSAAIRRINNAGQIRGLIQARMGAGSGCSSIVVNARTRTDGLGVTSLEVTTRCVLGPGFGGRLLGSIGPSDLTVTAAMPF